MTDKRAFEAKVDELLHAYGHSIGRYGNNRHERLIEAKTAVLAAYYAGWEAPTVAPLDEFNKAGGDLVLAEHVANAYNWFNDGWYARGKYTHPAPKSDAAADWVCVPREPTPEMMHEGACARMMSRDVGFIYARMIAASPARGGEGEKDAAMWEDEAHRLTGLIAEVVRLADSNPFCAIGHAVEHVIPHLREALTDALPPSVSEAERAAVSREAQ